MSKNAKKYDSDEDIVEIEEKEPIWDDDEVDESEDVDDESEIKISDEDDNIDIVIEIDDDDLDITDIEEKPIDTETDEDIVLSKHKIEGKHSLKYDSIFKGKKEDPIDEFNMEGFGSYQKDVIEVDKSSNYYFESIDNEKYIRFKLVKERVYSVLLENTSINFLNNRRKPSKVDFNHYYNLLKTHLSGEGFTNVELFNELAVYFSDNLLNMLKLLDKKWRNLLFMELEEHVGKGVNSKDIMNRNIYEGTEIEFEWFDECNESVLTITGVVIETDYIMSEFKVDSYENIYNVSIKSITKILNNNKFKYNLNKLNNIDFL